jgi:hypothetical protein
MDFVILCHHYQTAGVFIQPMYDARPRFTADPTQLLEPVQQGIHKSSAIAFLITCSSMHHHTRWFIDYCEPLILKDNVEWNVFR